MITTNYSTNNNQPAFGKFNFADGAKNIFKNKIKTPKDLELFRTICNVENQNTSREIAVTATLKNGTYSGSRLVANVGDGNWHTQGFFQSVNKFLEKMVEKANKYQKKQEFENDILKTISKEIDDIV